MMTEVEEIINLTQSLRDESAAIRNRVKFEKGYAEQRKNFEMLKNKIDEDDLTEEE